MQEAGAEGRNRTPEQSTGAAELEGYDARAASSSLSSSHDDRVKMSGLTEIKLASDNHFTPGSY